MTDEPAYMVGSRVDPLRNQPMVAGSIITRGSCGHDTWLSRSGIKIVAEQGLLLICDQCAIPMMARQAAAGEDVEVQVHPETIKEAVDEIRRSRDAQ